MDLFTKSFLASISVAALTACTGGGGGGGGSGSGIGQPLGNDMNTKIQFSTSECPTLNAKYRKPDTGSADGFAYKTLTLKTVGGQMVGDLTASFDFIVDGSLHPITSNEAEAQGKKLAYRVSCKNKEIRAEYFIDGSFIGYMAHTEINAKNDLQVVVKMSYQGKTDDTDETWERISDVP